MADNVYLLETRLSKPQQAALSAVREIARQHALTVFLVGGAVRDLISGSPVRDLDIAIQGNALDLQADLEAAGGVLSGRDTELRALYLRFPGSVRIEVGSTLSASYAKPGQPLYEPTSILEDLRRRDFTANAMALSLNDGSYGLLMDPLNGVADIENRELRLVSNYGFIEDPIRMVRAARLMARLGWQMDERTRARYETGKAEDYISTMRPSGRAYELEELFHEEDPLRVMRRLEEEGWLGQLSSSLAVEKANTAELGRLREVQMQFQTRGIIADSSAANFALLTAKLSAPQIEEIRKSFPRAGFVEEIATLEGATKELASKLLSKELSAPSAAFQYLMKAAATTVVYAAYSSRSTALQNRLKSFLTEWPNAQGKVPFVLMQEMRITPDLPQYAEIVERVTYALMDGALETPEEARAFLEPFSPPAPPPPISLRRPRAPRKEAKAKGKKKVVISAEAEGTDSPSERGEEIQGSESADAAEEKQAPASPSAKSVASVKTPTGEPVKPAKTVAKSVVPAKPVAATVSAAQPKAKQTKVAPPTPSKRASSPSEKARPRSVPPPFPAKTAAKGALSRAKVAERTGSRTTLKNASVKAKATVTRPAKAASETAAKAPAAQSNTGKKSISTRPATKAARQSLPAKRTTTKAPTRSAKKVPAKRKR